MLELQLFDLADTMDVLIYPFLQLLLTMLLTELPKYPIAGLRLHLSRFISQQGLLYKKLVLDKPR